MELPESSVPEVTANTPHRSNVYFPAGATLTEACTAAITSIANAHNLKNVVLVLRVDGTCMKFGATGKFIAHPPVIPMVVRNTQLIETARRKQSVTRREWWAFAQSENSLVANDDETLKFFPLIVGDEVKGVMIVDDEHWDENKVRALFKFSTELAMPLEVLRLRQELEQYKRVASHLHSFTEDVNTDQTEDAYQTILHHSTYLLRAERGSLLLFDEAANELKVKAATGPRAAIARAERISLSKGVAGHVLRDGRPLIVRRVAAGGHLPASAERHYKTDSFISYPIIAGTRKVGVLNVTDKENGGVYDDSDLRILEMIAPQVAMAIDRVEWHQRATQFQLLSITDPITGLLNRRYLEERLAEELERSKRHQYPMSFMMIDIDDFKFYNDHNGHQAGDLALKTTAQNLKSALRVIDVATRYGGDEFSILLPQTGSIEAQEIAERIRLRVASTPYQHENLQPSGAVTVSIGISTYNQTSSLPGEIINHADRALYAAKSAGKNCVRTHESK